MKKKFLILTLLISSIITYSQENSTYTDGYNVFRYPNGTISAEGTINNGKPDGFWKSYYVTGLLKSIGKRTNFLLDSVWVFFDQSGDTIEKINYLFGKKNGYYYKYKKDPSAGLFIWSKELYAADRKEGTAYFYFSDGKVKQTIKYNAGKKEGLSKEYDKEGNVITLFEYNNDFLTAREKINRLDDNQLKQGEWKEFHLNGNIKSEKSYKDDRLHGYYKEYDLKGNLILTMLYDNGAIVKSNIEDQSDIQIINKYDAVGKLIYAGPYRNKIPVGIHREYGGDGTVSNSKIYNDNGLLLSEGIVDEAGNKNGKWKDYFPDGTIQAEGLYTDSRRTGLWKFYSESGKTEQTGYFNNDRPDGIWKWYFENGSLLREEEYFQGLRDGSYVEYSKSGEIVASGTYSDGEKNSEWKFNTGNIIEEGKFIMGLKDGTWKSCYADGKIKFKGNFIQGNANGTHIYYFENGKVKEERYYQTGIRERTWKKFDENGILLLTITFRNDVEVSINGVRINLPESNVKLIK